MVAYDSAYPSNQATSDVTIVVLRNINGPIFLPSATYETSVSEDVDIGTTVITLTTQDRDEGVST